MNRERAKVTVRGAVQGVGFRPFVYRLASELHLRGWVANSAQGLLIEVEGGRESLEQFMLRIESDKPPGAVIQGLDVSFLPPAGLGPFAIRPSSEGGPKSAFVLPDIATCADCLREIFEPGDRRHLYPFANCTHCGPRFSIIESLPYDRRNTSMKKFAMCADCEREYHDPHDRRFHAQPNACPSCGPHLELWDPDGDALAKRHDALLGAASMVREGRIVALKGVGGFQLLVDARSDDAVRRLRERKHREEKPFALMYPALESARSDCRISQLEERLLLSSEAPIVLLERKSPTSNLNPQIAPAVAPNNPCFGVILPYSPLHHLLMHELGFPIVATSGNLSDEPICTEQDEAVQRLQGIADAFVVHNRPIVRHVDDSVVRVMLGRELVLRRARGYAPLPIGQGIKEPAEDIRAPSTLALGAHLKNAVALSTGGSVFVSQHIGDLETQQANVAFRKAASDLPRLYDAVPKIIVCDLHPDYSSTRHAHGLEAQTISVQHHYAHVLSCMAENDLEAPVVGVAWDGTGLGTDGTIWGGEFLSINETFVQRVAHLRQFRLPGGDAAIRQPRRSALGLLYEIFGDEAFNRGELIPLQSFSGKELRMLKQMLRNGINAPITSSAGRLFDGVAALIGLRQEVRFEGQAAMELEFAVSPNITGAYQFAVQAGAPLVVDWEPAVLGVLEDLAHGETIGVIAAKFHNGLADMIAAVAREVGQPRIVLTGGCFQNKYLTEETARRLLDKGFQVYCHRRVPPNDGGIALGQIAAAGRIWRHGFAVSPVFKRDGSTIQPGFPIWKSTQRDVSMSEASHAPV